MATAVGWYHRHMRDAAQSRSFASTQECIEARIKLEYEKEQQEFTQNPIQISYSDSANTFSDIPAATYDGPTSRVI
ncbi:hypothetical protein MRX96_027415 [Rhipicephalus microplus]